MWRQILLGSAILGLASAVHIVVLIAAIEILPRVAGDEAGVRWSLIFAAFAAILVGHTLQVWIWALTLRTIRAMSSLEDAIYFALVTSTTLGYGDITLQRKWRLFGAMAAVNGLLTFGLSTAFLLEVFALSYG